MYVISYFLVCNLSFSFISLHAYTSGKCAINDLTTYHEALTIDDIIDVGLADSATAADIETYKSTYFSDDISSNKMRPETTVSILWLVFTHIKGSADTLIWVVSVVVLAEFLILCHI